MRLLIADDELAVRRLVRFVVEKYCPEIVIVGEARDGRELIAQGLESKPDVLLTDIRMPELDGITAARELKKMLPHIQIIFLTAYEEFHYAREALALKAENYLVKPIRPEDLKKTLDACSAKLEKRLYYQELALKINTTLRRSRAYLKSYLFDQLLHGNLTACTKIATLISDSPIPEYILAIERGSAGFVADRPKVERLVRKLAGDELAVFLENIGPGLVLGLASKAPQPALDIAAVKEFAYRLKESLEKETGSPVTIGIGGRAATPQDVAQSFRQAQLALSCSFVLGPGRVIAGEDLDRMAKDISFLPLETELVTAVRDGDEQAAYEAADKMLLGLECLALDSPRFAKKLAAELAGILLAVAGERGVGEGELPSAELIKAKIQKADNFKELAQQFVDLTRKVAEAVNRQKEEGSRNIIQKAVAFIEANYAREITLRDVAKNVYLSPYYFSRLFRQKTGMNFAKYLSLTRINAAKKLLAEGRLPIREIAAQVGYDDPRYFSTVFKRLTGVLPSEYQFLAKRKQKVV